ncbi:MULTISPECIES: sulfotransferase [unclassified Mesorhizobium]|uniref:sulfotransferase family protein n=1 Tax=unclassified Mesorhizobium TaxID=325217 RepID=UPI0009ED92E0|nr:MULTISPECIES: sulfotransferase [unclassified Mesorhizobium]RWG06797.1 MAG: sulfotransferase [Mesorhizobium sp.]RWG96972.1 MAG: sulfotransferase [Mesorhizobium sp.]TIN45769.1 MAG: sulfotransferase [Mesorhizobium sp.]TIR93986.1 MAG: sulfotransferase [Mesorhizobium sp.]TIS03495.1 MAG: sulfotransferase [Mesorhizobium sp.]
MLETFFKRLRSGQSFSETRPVTQAGTQNYENVSVVFVCQAGEWEIKALLLAASLRRWCGNAIELIACVPGPTEVWGELSAETKLQLKLLGVRQQSIVNAWGREFSHANKISCLRVPVARPIIAFLDSDILCLGEPDFSHPGKDRIRIKLADAAPFENDVEVWKRIYAVCGVDFPDYRYPMTATSQYTLPFFNSGVMVVESSFAKKLADEWERLSAVIRLAGNLPDRRLWSDQLGLAVAFQNLGIKPQVMDFRQNHPTHLMPLSLFPDVRLSHYHWPTVLREEPKLVAELKYYVGASAEVRKVIEANSEWSGILGSRKRTGGRENVQPNTLLITGISRSGTSYLCQLVDTLSNAMALNETPELVTSLLGQGPAWGLATYLRRIRRLVAEGLPITNKVWNGSVINDTAVRDELSTYIPPVDSEDFTLAAKNTFAFLSSLPRIRRVLPEARIAVCVRNPIDTIASWKASFPHLLNADTSVRPVGNANDPWISPARSAELRSIAETQNLANRRAMLWRYLAERVLEDRGNHVLVKYEDLVVDPPAQLRRILGNWDAGTPSQPITSGRARSKRHVLDEEDLIAVSTICADVAAELGVWECS